MTSPRRGARPPAKSVAPAQISPARAAAFEILERVAGSSAHSDDLLHGPGMSALSQADRNLTTTLVLGVLRWQIALDALIAPLLARPDLVLASPVATALRLGAFQLRHLDRIPAHAALSESVELAKAAGHAHAAGMVNAILRKLTTVPPAKAKVFESTAALAKRLGHPAWLVERWVAAYGRAAAHAVCEYDQAEPQAGTMFAACDAPSVMDDGSRLVAELTAACIDNPARVWDCCAAPGGKTMLLARRHPEADLLATDVSARRLRAMGSRLQHDAPEAKVRLVEADATRLDVAEGEFDLILCDVPCSGTGTLGRNPEIRHHLRPSDLARQAVRQRELLAAGLSRLAPGGRLVYSTCSLEPEENEQVVSAVLAALPADSGIVAVDARGVLEALRGRGVVAAHCDFSTVERGGCLRTLPGSGFQGDGFFAAVLARA